MSKLDQQLLTSIKVAPETLRHPSCVRAIRAADSKVDARSRETILLLPRKAPSQSFCSRASMAKIAVARRVVVNRGAHFHPFSPRATH